MKIAGRMANSVYPDQTPPSVASDLGLYCLPKTVSSNTKGKYDSINNITISALIPFYFLCAFLESIPFLLFSSNKNYCIFLVRNFNKNLCMSISENGPF